MALNIKREEADRLARELSRLTGETKTQAVTAALRERLERVRQAQTHPAQERAPTPEEIEARVQDILDAAAEFRANMADTRPVTKEEWDDVSGENDLQVEAARFRGALKAHPGDAAA